MNPTSTQTDRIFELIYKKGGPAQKVHFKAPGLDKAVALGRKYCERNNLHFVFVNPWEMDLQELLNRKDDLEKAE